MASPEETTAVEEGRRLFSHGDIRVFASLYRILPQYVDTADVSVILDELRDTLYEGQRGEDNPGEALQSLHAHVRNCRACPNVKPDPHLPHWNRVDPDVVFVTDSPLETTSYTDIFVDALKKTGFRSQRVCATSVVRCSPADEFRMPNEGEISNCVSRYLFTELRLLSPRLIVTLGTIPTSTLVGETKITQDRGHVFWAGPWPVLPSYSPGYTTRSTRNKKDFLSDMAQAYAFVYGDPT